MNDSSLTTKGISKSRQVPQVDAPMVFSRLAESSFRFTILMNHLEHIDKDLLDIRSSLKVPYPWRVDDVVVTYSSIDSGIGYHAGHEDAFIVQASGQRHWQVWDGACTGQEARRRILLNEPDDYYPFERPPIEPILTCDLQPGDVLYIPPFFPHEGRTTETSISIALGWRGVAFFHLAYAFPQLIHLPRTAGLGLGLEFYDLLPDYDPSAGQVSIAYVANKIIERFVFLGCHITDETLLASRLVTLLNSSQ